ncbi:hypothetical protein KRX52_11165 [Pseudomonas sp. MAP12]|uniref:TubC N-terminal docking domain-containing protein n=1 Tax=Geopseudomonas aromaticivorans TaxID=2849492 RepID=A0ABS6MX18_9GAMM|nr:hypothetical protein [Pseudomonas aromaticivorans]MBV2133353.1 hypothetical protein [Pseudomonas aromaticivorans]
MSAPDLIRRLTEVGVVLSIVQDGHLQLSADRQPPEELLTELVRCKPEVIAALKAVNEPMPPSTWLISVARLLDTQPAALLEGKFLQQCDLIELARADAELVAETVRNSPAWIERPPLPEPAVGQFEEAGADRQHTFVTAATASPYWIAARDEYISHLMICHDCYAPRKHYCSLGNDLRQSYDHTPMEVNE